MSNTRHLFVSFNGLFQFVIICAAERGDHRFVLDKYESGHGGDVVLHGDILAFVHIDL